MKTHLTLIPTPNNKFNQNLNKNHIFSKFPQFFLIPSAMMLIHMRLHETLVHEPLPANGTTERLHLHVIPPVHFERVQRFVSLSALVARKLPLVRVDRLVRLEKLFRFKLFAARFTLGGGLCRVGFHVRPQRHLRGQLTATQLADGFVLATNSAVRVHFKLAVKVHAAGFVFAPVRFDS